MTSHVEDMVTGVDPRTPEWNVVEADVFADRIVARFIDGCMKVTTREQALNAMPEKYASALRSPAAFAQGFFNEEYGTVTWPNGADLSPEFLRWGPHKKEGCECGYSDSAAPAD